MSVLTNRSLLRNNFIPFSLANVFSTHQLKLKSKNFSNGKVGKSQFLVSKKLSHQKQFSSEKPGIIYKKLNVLDVGINYVELDGNSDHVVFCLPGSLSCIELDFIPLMQKLDPSKYKVVAWDPPGYGGSRPPERDFSGNFPQRDATYATELMKQLGHKKFSMLGWSAGALAAFVMAKEHPETVNKLVVWGAVGYFDEHLAAICQMLNEVGIEAIPKKRRKELLQMYGEESLKRMFKEWATLPTASFTVKNFLENGPATKNILNKLTCPTLIIKGEQDNFVHESQTDYLKKNIANSRVKLIPEGTHATHLGSTLSEFTTIVEEFLDEP